MVLKITVLPANALKGRLHDEFQPVLRSEQIFLKRSLRLHEESFSPSFNEESFHPGFTNRARNVSSVKRAEKPRIQISAWAERGTWACAPFEL